MSCSREGERAQAPDRRNADWLLAEVADLAAEVSAELSPTEVGRRLLQRGMVAMDASGGIGHVVDSLGASTDIVEVRGAARPLAAASEAIANGEEAWLSTSDATRGAGAIASVRLEIRGKCAGCLALSFEEEREFPESERSFLRVLGRILSQEVDRAGLRARERAAERDRAKHARRANALVGAFRLITSPASLTSILEDLARVSCEIPADLSAIRILSEDGASLKCVAVHHRDPERNEIARSTLAGRSTPANLGQTAGVIEKGTSVLVPQLDMSALSSAYAGTPFGDYVTRFPLSTAMIVPLGARGSVFGVVAVARSEPDPFEQADLRFLEEVAERAAAALDNARLLQKVARSEEQLRVALEAGRLGAWDWDIPAQRVTWSAMLEKIHGIAAGSFPGTFEAYQRDIHPEDREEVLSTIMRTVEERADYHVFYRIVRPDDEVRWLEAQGRLLCDPAGTPQRLVGMCVDITERRKSEEQLGETLLALREADRRKDEFLAMLAHELRNPLGPMLNATHILGLRGLEEASAERARQILDRQVRHMARLLEDLLDVSRITRGKIDLARATVDVAALAREVTSDREELFRAAGLAVEVTVSAEPLLVQADRTRLAQVIGNLLSNALKFSERGQSVRVHLDRDTSGKSVVLTVRDQGAGLTPTLIDHMFDPFVQGDTSLARPRGGLGLGLAVVKGLVALHGGRVSASSDGLGKGAELRVELPLHTAPPEIAPSLAPVPPEAQGSAAMVLLFEDNADAAESLRVILSGAGYRVWIEPTGRHANEVVRRIRPDVVLCDLGLPDRDGYAIASDIRSDSDSSHLPLIAITGYGTVEDQIRSRQAGFDLHLTKPVLPALLVSELSRRLASASTRSL